jgi:AbiU2
MQPQLTDDEVRAEYIRVMGGELGLLYSELQDELEWLRDKWGEYHQLFCNGPERIDMLNAVASNFFVLLQRLLFDDAMMHLSRLTDPPQSAGRDTLTVMRLADQIHDPSLKASAKNQAAQARARCEFALSLGLRILPLCLSSPGPRIRRGSIPPANSAMVETSPLWDGARTLSWLKPNPLSALLKFPYNSPTLGSNPSPTQRTDTLAS